VGSLNFVLNVWPVWPVYYIGGYFHLSFSTLALLNLSAFCGSGSNGFLIVLVNQKVGFMFEFLKISVVYLVYFLV
jgi:hypothetical protein